MDETVFLNKYVAASTTAYPITMKFCAELQKALNELKTDAEKKADKEEHDRITKFLEKERQDKIDAAYNRGVKDGHAEVIEGKLQHFDIVLDNGARVSISIDKLSPLSELREILDEAERKYGDRLGLVKSL